MKKVVKKRVASQKEDQSSTIFLIVPIPMAIIIFLAASALELSISVAGKQSLLISFFRIGIPVALLIFWIIYLIYYLFKNSKKNR